MSNEKNNKESKLIPKIYWLILMILMIGFLWNRMDIITMNRNSISKIDNIEKIIYPTIPINNAYVLGVSKAPVKLVIFSDFDDEESAKFYHNIFKQLLMEYVVSGKVNVVFKQFPIHSDKSMELAAMIMCSGDQFWTFHNAFYEAYPVTSQQIQDLVDRKISNHKNFTQCLTSSSTAKSINNDLNIGDNLGVFMTPTVFINDKISINGNRPYSHYKSIIDELISEAGSS